MGLVLAIDLGTTNLKVGVIDASGEILRCERKQINLKKHGSGSAEHDLEELKAALIELCQLASKNYRDQIKLIVLSTYQFGLVLLDKDRQPLTGLTTLVDTRSQSTQDEFMSVVSVRDLYNRTGCPPFFQYPLARLFYLKKKQPESYDKISYAMSSKAYLMHELTGEFVSDASTEAASQMMNLSSREWDQETLDLFGIDKSWLPRIVEPKETSFKLQQHYCDAIGLPAEVRVLPGVYDGGAVGLGLGGFGDSTGVINIGTTGMLRVASKTPVVDQDERMRFQTYYLMDDLYLTGGGINNATLPARWMKENLFNQGYPEMLGIASEAPPGSQKLFFLPYLTGERDWMIGNSASGVLFGLRNYHSKSDMVRSLLEGVGYCLAMIKQALEENSVNINSLRIGGGGSKQALWLEIIASIMNLELQKTEVEESCLVGDGILGHTHLGEYKDILEASEEMVKLAESVKPDQELAKLYQSHSAFYQELYLELADAYRRHAEFLR